MPAPAGPVVALPGAARWCGFTLLLAQYFGSHRMPPAQSGYLLGLADQRMFSLGCKRWFDLRSGAYRN